MTIQDFAISFFICLLQCGCSQSMDLNSSSFSSGLILQVILQLYFDIIQTQFIKIFSFIFWSILGILFVTIPS